MQTPTKLQNATICGYIYNIFLIRDMVVESWYRQFGRETIHPTQKFTSMNLLQMPWVIT